MDFIDCLLISKGWKIIMSMLVERFECCGFWIIDTTFVVWGGCGSGVERVVHQKVCGSSPAAPVSLGKSLNPWSWAVCDKCSTEWCCVNAARTVKCLWVVVKSREALCRHSPFRLQCLYFLLWLKSCYSFFCFFSFSTLWISRLASAGTDLRWNLLYQPLSLWRESLISLEFHCSAPTFPIYSFCFEPRLPHKAICVRAIR